MNISSTQQQAKAIIDHFDKLSANNDWSRLYAVADGITYHFHIRRRRVLELLPARLGEVLDVGCGPGVMVEAVLERGGTFHGLDLSPQMVREGQEKFGHLNGVSFGEGNIERLDLPNAVCDQVIAMAVIEYLVSPHQALREIARVLRPGGIAVVTVPKRLHIDKSLIAATRPFRMLARSLGMGSADTLPRLCLQPDELDEAASTAGLIPDGGSQYHFTPFPYPVPRLAPQAAMRLNAPFERLHGRRGKLTSFLAHGYVGRYRRS
jgi:ubiquinone/menaquinone biosynthesis C-methylase UbiE